MEPATILFIALGAIVMFLCSLLCRNLFDFSLVKTILISLLLTVAGVASVVLMFFFENGHFGGVSFFGAVLFVPLLLIPFALLLKIRWRDYLDIAAPMVSAMLAVMKINCLRAGCCAGIVLRYNNGEPVRFPSQIVEMAVALAICGLLIWTIRIHFLPGAVYPLFMITYGATRFALNLLRETTGVFYGFAIGNVWAVVSVIIGIIWIVSYSVCKKRHGRTDTFSKVE